jgi:hypothetical protein
MFNTLFKKKVQYVILAAGYFSLVEWPVPTVSPVNCWWLGCQFWIQASTRTLLSLQICSWYKAQQCSYAQVLRYLQLPIFEIWGYYILGLSSSFDNSIVQILLVKWQEKMVPNHFINNFMFYATYDGTVHICIRQMRWMTFDLSLSFQQPNMAGWHEECLAAVVREGQNAPRSNNLDTLLSWRNELSRLYRIASCSRLQCSMALAAHILVYLRVHKNPMQ